MNIYSIMESACAALVADATLQANAQLWYGKALSVFIDQDRDNPPQGDDDTDSLAPSIQLTNWYDSASESERTQTCGFFMMITVADPDDAVRADDVVELKGTERLNSIIRRAREVIRASKDDSIDMSYKYETDLITFFPAMTADVDVGFTAELTIGQDPFD